MPKITLIHFESYTLVCCKVGRYHNNSKSTPKIIILRTQCPSKTCMELSWMIWQCRSSSHVWSWPTTKWNIYQTGCYIGVHRCTTDESTTTVDWLQQQNLFLYQKFIFNDNELWIMKYTYSTYIKPDIFMLQIHPMTIMSSLNIHVRFSILQKCLIKKKYTWLISFYLIKWIWSSYLLLQRNIWNILNIWI